MTVTGVFAFHLTVHWLLLSPFLFLFNILAAKILFFLKSLEVEKAVLKVRYSVIANEVKQSRMLVFTGLLRASPSQ
jgi:hypothetical protein